MTIGTFDWSNDKTIYNTQFPVHQTRYHSRVSQTNNKRGDYFFFAISGKTSEPNVISSDGLTRQSVYNENTDSAVSVVCFVSPTFRLCRL